MATRRKRRPNLSDYKGLARQVMGIRHVDDFCYEVIAIELDPATGELLHYLERFAGRELRSVPVSVPCYLKVWDGEDGDFNLEDDFRFLIDPATGEALSIEISGRHRMGERARALLLAAGQTWAQGGER